MQVIRGLATGVLQPSGASALQTLRQQAAVGLLLAMGLSAGGFFRVFLTTHDTANSFAISASLFLIGCRGEQA